MHHDHNHSHGHHRRRSSVVSRSKTCPHHNRRRKYSTSCSTLHGSIKLGSTTHCNISHHGSAGSVFELPLPPNDSPPPPIPPHAPTSPFHNGNGHMMENGHSVVLTPSKVKIENGQQSSCRMNGANSNGKTNGTTTECTYEGCTYGIVDYEQTPSPLNWNFVAAGDGDPQKNESYYMPVNGSTVDSSSLASEVGARKPEDESDGQWHHGTSTNSEDFNAVVFRYQQESQVNCCNSLVNPYEDQASGDVSVSEAELNEFFGKGFNANNNHHHHHHLYQTTDPQAPPLNNAVDIESHPTIDILNRNDISAVIINQLNLSPDFREYGKSSNLNQNPCNLTPSRTTTTTSDSIPGKSNVCNSNFWSNHLGNNKLSNNASSLQLQSSQPDPSLILLNNVSTDSHELFNISRSSTTTTTNRNNPTTTTTTTDISLTTQNHFETTSRRLQDYHQQSGVNAGAGHLESSSVHQQDDASSLECRFHGDRSRASQSRIGGLLRVVRNRTKRNKTKR